jgi:phage major head subunit gpT-like protein
MIVDANALANIYVGLNTAFHAAFQTSEVWHPQVAMTVPASTKIMDYKFMLEFPMVREWIGDRVVRTLEGKSYQITTQDWEATIELDRNDIRDDQIGLYSHVVSALGEEARGHPDRLIADLLLNGWTELCFDGRPFLATDQWARARPPMTTAARTPPGFFWIRDAPSSPSFTSCASRCNSPAWTGPMTSTCS